MPLGNWRLIALTMRRPDGAHGPHPSAHNLFRDVAARNAGTANCQHYMWRRTETPIRSAGILGDQRLVERIASARSTREFRMVDGQQRLSRHLLSVWHVAQ